MKLVIVESPAKAKTIEKYLGKDFTVAASVGHVRDLPKSNKKAISIEDGYVPHYEISKGKDVVIDKLSNLVSKADDVILATDPDREGEAIAWHLKEALKLKSPKRVTFNEITKQAVLDAMEHPRKIDENLRQAQEARRVLDRLVGYDLSGVIWKKVRYGLSAGRVQSPALRILAEREREIKAFIPSPFVVLEAHIQNPDDTNTTTLFSYHREIFEIDTVPQIIKACEEKAWTILDVKSTPAKREPKAPFTTSSLQQAASNRYGFSPSRTMGIAQKLYESGHITYMRTDSPNLSTTAITGAAAYITSTFGKEYHESRNFSSKSKNAQEAHEAIRPTNLGTPRAGNNEEQEKLYQLIWERTIASQMAPAQVLRTKVTASPRAHTEHVFSATGSVVTFDGWLKVIAEHEDDERVLPQFEAQQNITLTKLERIDKETQPPNRYSEAGLVKELEKRGIGRPSTYASIISTLEDRGYVEKQGRTLFPTDTGMVVSGFLEEHFTTYIGDTFTATMEDALDDIGAGTKEYAKTLDQFYKPFKKVVAEKTKTSDKITDLGPAPKEFPCPLCGKSMVYKLSRNGTFMSCSTFPDCTGARKQNGEIMAEDAPIGTNPSTGNTIFVREGRFGVYVEETDGGTFKKRASVPPGTDRNKITVTDALVWLSLPRLLGQHPDGGDVTAAAGRFGPFIAHNGVFASIKTPDDVYTIELPRALALLEEKIKRLKARGKYKPKLEAEEALMAEEKTATKKKTATTKKKVVRKKKKAV